MSIPQSLNYHLEFEMPVNNYTKLVIFRYILDFILHDFTRIN